MPSTAHDPAAPCVPVTTRSRRIEPAGSARTNSSSGRARLKKPRQPGERSRRADADDDRVDVVAHLLPDLGSGRQLVGERVGRVVELVGEERARDPRGDARREVLVVVGVALADVAARRSHLGAERLQVQHLLARHLVGNDEDDAVALGARDQREAEPGVAGSAFDHRSAGLQPAVALGGLDHRQADPVLDRAAGILRLRA
jgi:hypothetical protein